jgi:hypothetical protein
MDLLQIRKELCAIEDHLHKKERVLRKIYIALEVLSKKFADDSVEFEMITNLMLDLDEV